MGMFDYLVVLDRDCDCPHGHRVDGFQTKSFQDPGLDVYLLENARAISRLRVGRFEPFPFD